MRNTLSIFLAILLFLSLLSACAEKTEQPNTPNESGNTETPGVTDDPNQSKDPQQPNEPDKPDVSDEPDETDEPNEPDEPDKPNELDEPITHTHAFDEGKVAKEATCKEAGVKIFTCACGETKMETIAKLSMHTWDEGIKSGININYTCTVCSEERSERQNSINILVIGAKVYAALARDSDVLLETLLKADADIENANVDSIIAYGSMGRIDNLFTWKRISSGEYIITGINTETERTEAYNAIKAALSPDASLKYDYVIIAEANNWNLVDGQPYAEREVEAFLHFEEMIAAHNSNATLVVSLAPPLERYDMSGNIELYSNGKVYYIADNEHGIYKKIIEQGERIYQALRNSETELNVILSNVAKTWLNVWESGENVCDMYNDGYTWPSGKDNTSTADHYKCFYYPFEATAYCAAATWFCDITQLNSSVISVTQWASSSAGIRDITDDGEACDLDVIKAAIVGN